MVTAEKVNQVEQGEFAWIEKPWEPKTLKNYPFAKVSGCNRVLLDAQKDFRITSWGLARLLGLKWLHNIYGWLDGSRRPSQMYVIRLCKLYQLHLQGIKLIAVHHINWDGDGEIVYKEVVNVSGNGGVTRNGRQVSEAESKNRDKMAKFRAQSPR